MSSYEKRPLMIQLFSFGYQMLFAVFTAGMAYLSIFSIYHGEIGLAIFMMVGVLFFGMPFYVRSTDEMIRSAKNIGPVVGSTQEVARSVIDSAVGFGYLLVALAAFVAVVFIGASIVGFVASMPIGFLLTVVILLLLFRR